MVHRPVQTPTEKKRRVMELANMEMARPNEAMRAPMIVTILHPNLLTSVLAIGPGMIVLKLSTSC